jgi:hypothetical protein
MSDKCLLPGLELLWTEREDGNDFMDDSLSSNTFGCY